MEDRGHTDRISNRDPNPNPNPNLNLKSAASHDTLCKGQSVRWIKLETNVRMELIALPPVLLWSVKICIKSHYLTTSCYLPVRYVTDSLVRTNKTFQIHYLYNNVICSLFADKTTHGCAISCSINHLFI